MNTALLGAVVRVCPFLEPDAVRETIRATFGRRHPEVVEANIRTFDRGFASCASRAFEADRPGRGAAARRGRRPPSAISRRRSAA